MSSTFCLVALASFMECGYQETLHSGLLLKIELATENSEALEPKQMFHIYLRIQIISEEVSSDKYCFTIFFCLILNNLTKLFCLNRMKLCQCSIHVFKHVYSTF